MSIAIFMRPTGPGGRGCASARGQARRSLRVPPVPPRALAAGLLLGLLLLPGCRPHVPAEPERIAVRITEATAAGPTLRPRTEYIGLARGDVETDLSFKVGGVLELIGSEDSLQDWQEGAPIAAGQVLARLKQEDFHSQVKSAEARAQLDRLSLERNQKLREQGAISPQELDVIAANRQASEAALAQARQALADSVIRAPYPGRILARLANKGETILPGRPVLRVADLRQMSVEFGVPDKLLEQVRVGRVVQVEFPGLEGRPFAGRISEVGVFARDGARLFRVIAKVPNTDGVLKSGMAASIAIESEAPLPAGSVLVPLSALVAPARAADPRQLAVYVVDADGRARERTVATGDFVRSSVLVTSGVQPGEKVVVVGASLLHDGALVNARPAERF
jgi:multidrug efflux system membrane fusion protein